MVTVVKKHPWAGRRKVKTHIQENDKSKFTEKPKREDQIISEVFWGPVTELPRRRLRRGFPPKAEPPLVVGPLVVRAVRPSRNARDAINAQLAGTACQEMRPFGLTCGSLCPCTSWRLQVDFPIPQTSAWRVPHLGNC